MAVRNALKSQQSAPADPGRRAAPGCWSLGSGRALSLHPRRASVLALVSGRVWLTISATSPSASPQPGSFASSDASGSFSSTARTDRRIDLPAAFTDQVLTAGDRVVIPAGARVVVEAWAVPGQPDTDAAFRWDMDMDRSLAGAVGQVRSGSHAQGKPDHRASGGLAAPSAPQPSGKGPIRADWETGVAMPLRELAQALGQGGRVVGAAAALVLRAAARLALGVGRFVWLRVAAPVDRKTV